MEEIIRTTPLTEEEEFEASLREQRFKNIVSNTFVKNQNEETKLKKV